MRFLQVNKKAVVMMVTRYLSLCNYLWLLGYSQEKQVLHNYCVIPSNPELKLPSHPSNFTEYCSQRWRLSVATLTSQCCLFAFSNIWLLFFNIKLSQLNNCCDFCFFELDYCNREERQYGHLSSMQIPSHLSSVKEGVTMQLNHMHS